MLISSNNTLDREILVVLGTNSEAFDLSRNEYATAHRGDEYRPSDRESVSGTRIGVGGYHLVSWSHGTHVPQLRWFSRRALCG